MSYNNNFHNATFRNAFLPPIPPPPVFVHPQTNKQTDADVVKYFESKISHIQPRKVKPQLTISEIRDQIFNLLSSLNNLKNKEKELLAGVNDMSDEDWESNLKDIETNKQKIDEILAKINDLNFDVLGKLLSKRCSKRARLKRVRAERKREKEERMKEMKERSRKIDENLQKIKDDIDNAKKEEEAKLQADLILKETLRKKHDAKKCIAKLEALMKLRRARLNTAKGRGENIVETEAVVFENNIGKLKSLWSQKLALYDKEECELRAQLCADSDTTPELKDMERDVTNNLQRWREVMFGGTLPQVEFNGDVEKFLFVRSEWDQFINPEGTPIPIGWVPPVQQNTNTHS